VLAFVRTTESGWGIHVINAGGSEQRLLMSDPVSSCCLDWSPP
jgi:hypothetical protein